jgi:Reverse transcriptase (RNA-dependent DNA polymerase)
VTISDTDCKIFYHNVNGLVGKTLNFYEDLLVCNPEVFCFTETLMTFDFEVEAVSKDYKIFQSKAKQGDRGRPYGGIIVGIKNGLTKFITLLAFSQYSMTFTIKAGDLDACLIFTYVSPDKAQLATLDKVYEHIHCMSLSYSDIMVIGDLNCRIGNFDLLKRTRPTNDLFVNKPGQTLQLKLAEFGLRICNGSFPGDANGNFTFCHSNGNGNSVVDLALCTQSFFDKIGDFQVLDNSLSDHFPILVTLQNKMLLSTPNETLRMWRLDLTRSEVSAKAFQHKLDEHLAPLTCTNVEEGGNDLLDSIYKAAEYSGLRPKECKKRESKVNKYEPKWFNSKCRLAKKLKNKNLRKFRRNEITSHAFSDSNSLYKATLKARKEEHKAELTAKLSNHKNPKEFWKAVKSINGSSQKDNPIKAKQWEDHYTSIFEENDIVYVDETETWSDLPKTNDKPFEANITTQELSNTIRKLKKGKAPGYDGLPNETWILSSPKLRTFLCIFFNLCCTVGRVPYDWCKVVVSPIHKKGCNLNPSNYRPIALVQTKLKLLTTVLAKRLINWIKLNSKIGDYQAGFKPKSGCDEHIFVLNTLIQSCFARKRKMYACFIDLSQAFDSVPHDRLWVKLAWLKVPHDLIRLLRFIYANATARIKSSTGLSKDIKIGKGVLQGESLSPYLFNLYLEDVVTMFQDCPSSGIKLASGRIVHILMYADDMILMAPDRISLQRKLNILVDFFDRNQLKVNLEKTKVMIFRKNAGRIKKDDKLFWKKNEIEIVSKYIYLGITFTTSGMFREAAQHSIKKAIIATQTALAIIRRAKLTNFDSICYIFDSVVQSTLLYASSVYALRYLQKLERIQRTFFLRLFKLSYRTPGYFIRLETGRLHIKAKVLQQSIKFLARLLTKPTDSLIADCLNELRKMDKNDSVFNWLGSLDAELRLIDCSHILEITDSESLLRYLPAVAEKYQILLVNNDVMSMINSVSHPHYSKIKTHVWRENYLKLGNLNLVSVAMQLRLHEGSLRLNSKFYDLEAQCRYCGLPESISHIIQECMGVTVARNKYLSTNLDDNFIFEYPDNIKECTRKVHSISNFLTDVFKFR